MAGRFEFCPSDKNISSISPAVIETDIPTLKRNDVAQGCNVV